MGYHVTLVQGHPSVIIQKARFLFFPSRHTRQAVYVGLRIPSNQSVYVIQLAQNKWLLVFLRISRMVSWFLSYFFGTTAWYF